jgi:uncharacterized membrane protein
MQGLRRKVVHATLYEAIAIALVTLGMAAAGQASVHTGLGLSVAMSVLAMAWNMAYSTVFEAWERRQPSKVRTWQRRVAHALGFEGGLMLLTIPVIMWMLQVGLWQAVVADVSLVVFFLVYTFAFNWAFDRVFGLPVTLEKLPPLP